VELEPSVSKFNSITVSPHVELIMAPHAGFDTDQIKDKSRKDLLYLLEGVSKDYRLSLIRARHRLIGIIGPREEEFST
jgi:hypothetical protein